MMKPKPKSIQCSGSVHFDTSGWLHYWRLSFEKKYQNCFNTRSFGCLKAAVSLTVNPSSVVSHLQVVRGCVHVFASWLPAHDWEVTVQLLRAGPDCQALLDTAPHQALYSLLSLCLLSGPWLDPLPCDSDILTLGTHEFSNFQHEGLEAEEESNIFIFSTFTLRALLNSCIWGDQNLEERTTKGERGPSCDNHASLMLHVLSISVHCH